MQFTLHVLGPYKKNEIFSPESPLNRDDYLFSFRKLKQEFEKRGHQLNTQDISPSATSDGTIFIDMPKKKDLPKNSYLILQESEVVRPDNYNLNRHKDFKGIFTWKDSLVDSQRYFKLNFCHKILQPRKSSAYFADKRLITLISGNKMSRHPKQLYSARKSAIKKLEMLVGHEFAYYGPGWERFYLSNTKILKAFKKIGLEWLLPKQQTSSYEGLIKDKLEGLGHFRFCLCFENAKEIPGYITEKIFDCFFAGVVPVYWGAPDIQKFIPEQCFIDYRKFDSTEDLVRFLKDMDESTFDRHLKAAADFLKSDASKLFSGEHFASVVADRVVDV